MSNSRSAQSVELATYPSGRIELDMSFDQYVELNLSAETLEGKTLSTLAEEDPAFTYSLIRKMVGSFAIDVNAIYINDSLVISKPDDGEEATRNMAAGVLVSRMPEAHEGRIDFSLGIATSEDDRALFGEGAKSRLSVLDIVVEPSQYI